MVESYSELDELEEAEETLAELKVMLAHHSEDAAAQLQIKHFYEKYQLMTV
jgi:hypothetical protein